MLKYTICFIKRGSQLLLLNRNKKPNMGSWNGVGGKIEENETPKEGIIRETYEETGIMLNHVDYAGIVVWESNRGNSGMYVFMANLPSDVDLITPIRTEEGILEWKEINWILASENKGIVDNVKKYLPYILDGEYDLEHKFKYEDGVMLDYSVSSLIRT